MTTPRYQRGDAVTRRSNPSQLGIVVDEPEEDCGDWWYVVQFGKQRVSLIEQELETAQVDAEEPEQIAAQGRWGPLEALRRAIALERILTPSRSTIYAFDAQRIQFAPHQYKPLLRFLDSEDRRLLIADEVGLGKTIEAGLVLAEMEARNRMERILVLCPPRLRQKWQQELFRKFRQDFDIWGTDEIRKFASKVAESPERNHFRAVASIHTLRRPDILNMFDEHVGALDLVILDEAHHARNRETATYQMMERMSEIADGILLLTATPLHLRNTDLFHLLRLLRPTEFRDAYAFEESLKRNEGIVFAQRVVRARNAERLREAGARVRSSRGIDSAATPDDPLVAQAIQRLEGPPPEDLEGWLELEQRLDACHVLSHVLTRTRKRDVEAEAPVRQAHWVGVNWTPAEHHLYCHLAGLDPERPAAEQRYSLGSITRARQAASSVHGTFLYRYEKNPSIADDLSDLENEEDLADTFQIGVPLPRTDTKYEKLRDEILVPLFEEHPDTKVLVFTYFIGTSLYLEKRLNEEGISTLRIAGDVPSDPRFPERDERAKVIERFRTDPGVRVLVSSEVGSEGLDFQFAWNIVNYDLPWNPMVVEQRIGRIDRFGQQSKIVHIYALVVRNTVEDRILERLYSRIELFERSIGDLETIIGEEVEELRRLYFTGQLTAEQAVRRAEQAAAAIKKRERDTRELEQQASELIGHEEFIREELQRVQNLGRYLTQAQLLAVVRGFLQMDHPSLALTEVEDGIFRLRVSEELLRQIGMADRRNEGWERKLRYLVRDGGVLLTTQGRLAFDRPNVDLLNATHPLVRVAGQRLENLMGTPHARVGSARLHREHLPEDDLPIGVYYLAVYVDVIQGMKHRRLVEPVAWHSTTETRITGHAAERLMHLVVEHGEDHPDPRSLPALDDTARRALRSLSRQRKVALETAEKQEANSLYDRRRERFLSERDRKIAVVHRRYETALARGSVNERLLKMRDGAIAALQREFDKRVEELERGREVQVELQGPIALCAIEIIEEEP